MLFVVFLKCSSFASPSFSLLPLSMHFLCPYKILPILSNLCEYHCLITPFFPFSPYFYIRYVSSLLPGADVDEEDDGAGAGTGALSGESCWDTPSRATNDVNDAVEPAAPPDARTSPPPAPAAADAPPPPALLLALSRRYGWCRFVRWRL